VTAVIPIWSTNTAEDDIKVSTREEDQGLDINVNGPEYAGYVDRHSFIFPGKLTTP
jgi:hypothetical protein